MGHFIEGEWQPGFYKPDSGGNFVRTQTVYRNSLEKEALQKKRYLLCVSLACPWAHRILFS